MALCYKLVLALFMVAALAVDLEVHEIQSADTEVIVARSATLSLLLTAACVAVSPPDHGVSKGSGVSPNG